MLAIAAVIILLILLLWHFKIKGLENYSEDVMLATSGVFGSSKNLGSYRSLSAFLGSWIWRSDDELREQILTVNMVDEYFLQLQLTTNITSWYPPINNDGSPWTSRKKTFEEHLPICRVIVISDNEIVISPVNKTYVNSGPIHLRAYPDLLEYQGKKFYSSLVQRTRDAKKLIEDGIRESKKADSI